MPAAAEQLNCEFYHILLELKLVISSLIKNLQDGVNIINFNLKEKVMLMIQDFR